jgi:hypothetical protein
MRHKHRHELTLVERPKVALIEAMFGKPAAQVDATRVLYLCKCGEPGGIVVEVIPGFWSLEQLKGGEAQVKELRPVPEYQDAAAGEPDPPA